MSNSFKKFLALCLAVTLVVGLSPARSGLMNIRAENSEIAGVPGEGEGDPDGQDEDGLPEDEVVPSPSPEPSGAPKAKNRRIKEEPPAAETDTTLAPTLGNDSETGNDPVNDSVTERKHQRTLAPVDDAYTPYTPGTGNTVTEKRERKPAGNGKELPVWDYEPNPRWTPSPSEGAVTETQLEYVPEYEQETVLETEPETVPEYVEDGNTVETMAGIGNGLIGPSRSAGVMNSSLNPTGSSSTEEETNDSGKKEPTAPGAPANLNATPGPLSITVSFAAPENNGGADITGYTVTATPDYDEYAPWLETLTWTGGAPGTVVFEYDVYVVNYTVTVTAANEAGMGEPATTTVLPEVDGIGGGEDAEKDLNEPQGDGETPAATAPGAPTKLNVQTGTASITLSFEAPENNGGAPIKHYNVTATPDEIGEYSPVITKTVTQPGSYTFGWLDGVHVMRTYTVSVTATNDANLTGEAAVVTNVKPTTAVPTPMTISTFAISSHTDTTADFTWPAATGATTVELYVSTTSGSAGFAQATYSGTLNATSTGIAVTGLTASTQYWFKLVVTGGTDAGDSNVVNLTTNATPVPISTFASSSHTDTTADFTWPAATGATTVELHVSTTSSSAGFAQATYSGTLNATSTGVTVTGLTPLTQYWFKLVVTSGSSAGDSNVVTLTTTTITTPSATISNGTVAGTVGTAITPLSFTITLANDTFVSAIAAGTNVSAWFTNLPAGLSAGVTTAAAAGGTTIGVTISGTPTAASTADLAVTIPGTALTSAANLTVAANASANFNIVVPAGTPSITINQSGTYAFSNATEGYGAQTALTVTVTNNGSVTINNLAAALSGTNAGSFTITSPVLTTLASGASTSFTVVPNTGLTSNGTTSKEYTATVTVSGTPASGTLTAQAFNLSFTVLPTGTTYKVAYSSGSSVSATVPSTGYANPNATYTIPSTTPTASGYTFSYWLASTSDTTATVGYSNTYTSTSTRLNGAKFMPGNKFIMPAADVTLTAVWTSTTSSSSSWWSRSRSRTQTYYPGVYVPYYGTAADGATPSITSAIVNADAAGRGAITLQVPAGRDYVDIGYDSVQKLVELGMGLNVKSALGNFAFGIPASALKNLNMSSGGVLRVIIRPVSSSVQGALAGTCHEVLLYVNGQQITSFNYPVEMAFNMKNTAQANSQSLCGIRDNGGGKFDRLGGRMVGGDLVVNTTSLSRYAVIVAENMVRLNMRLGDANYTLNSRKLSFDSPPTVVADRVMVPLRFITEAFGATVTWNDSTKTATVSLDGKVTSVTIGRTSTGMDVAPVIINNRTLVPLRYIAESFGANVVWDDETREIDIYR